MKNILFLAPFESKGRFSGGIASYANSISNDNFFKEQNIQLIPVSTSRIRRDAYSGGKFTFKNFVNFSRIKRAIKHELKKNDIDSMYINSSRNYALLKDLLIVKRFSSKRLETIIHIHFAEFDNVFPKNKFARKICLKILKNKVSKIITLSSTLKSELIKSGVDKKKIYVLRNYFDQKLPTKELSVILKDKPHSPINYVFIGSITLRKGIDVLLSAFSKLDQTYHLTVCGTPNDINGDKLIEKYRSLKNVSFMGFLSGDKKSEILNKSDVFVLPTLAEGLPISLLEALNAGLGIITTNVGAIPEIISNRNGFVIRPGSEGKLIEALSVYHDNFELLKEHKVNNLKESEKYCYDRFKQELLGIIN